MIVPATIRATAHADDPTRVGHLVVDLAQSRRHLVGQSARHDHHVRLTGRGAEDDAQPILIVARGRQVHHLDGTASQPERHGPERTLPGPICNLVEGGTSGQSISSVRSMSDGRQARVRWNLQDILKCVLRLLLTWQGDLPPWLARRKERRTIFLCWLKGSGRLGA